LIDCSLRPDFASMTMNDALDSSEAYPSTFKRVRMMQALKDPEQLVYIFHIKACTVVSYEYYDLIFVSIDTSDFDLGLRLRARELRRIGEKVDENELEHGAVSITDRKGVDFPDNITTVCLRTYFAESFRHQLFEVYLCFLRFDASDA
jgi:hypothetical protein